MAKAITRERINQYFPQKSMSYTERVKSVAKRRFPSLYKALGSVFRKILARSSGFDDSNAKMELMENLLQSLPPTVISGPFKGLRYVTQSCGSVLLPKLLGTYEKELHKEIASLLATSYAAVINVGCGEGYYAVGFAAKSKATPVVHAFDINIEAQQATKALAALNNVSERIVVGGLCDSKTLESLLDRRALILCDIEGGEMDLLDLARVPSLKACDFVVEVHDGLGKSTIRDSLVSRFHETHDITHVVAMKRTIEDAPALGFVVSKSVVVAAMDERRQFGIEWLVMRAH